MSGCFSAAWITRPMRVRVSSSHTDTSMSIATSMMNERDLGNCVPYSENSGPCSASGRP
ncbi:hypothetical protein D9M68_476720 [compost metagenome]